MKNKIKPEVKPKPKLKGIKYYVDSKYGNDGNDGVVEDRAFKSLQHAMEMAMKSDIIILTVKRKPKKQPMNFFGTGKK
jgi:hypothetical protein